MKNIIMKEISKKMIKASLLVFFTSMLPMVTISAQSWTPKPLYYELSGALIEVGDSVKIHIDSLHYETSEKKSTWVYNLVHTVQQVGSKYHPEAVLLRGIYSWVWVGSIEPLNKAKLLAETPIAEPIADSVPDPLQEPILEPDTIVELETIVEQDTIVSIVEDVILVEESTLVEEITDIKPAEVNRFSIGIHGGFASSMAKPAKLPLGYDVLLDLQYAHYWPTSKNKVQLGILTGLSIGYMSSTRNQAWDETFVVSTSDGDVEYHVTADNIEETSHQLQLEVPLMFSMITSKGFFLNVGPRFLLPAYTPYKQVITNGNVVATDLETGVVIPNNPVYGFLSENQVNQKGMGNQQFDLTFTLGVELGYEFRLKSGNSIGLGAYANYGLYSMFSNNPLGSAISVTSPDGNTIGAVSVESLTNAYTEKLGHVDAGIKLSYNLDFLKK